MAKEAKNYRLCSNCRHGGVSIDGEVRTWICRAADRYALRSPITGDMLTGMVSDCATQRFGGFCGFEGRLWEPSGESE